MAEPTAPFLPEVEQLTPLQLAVEAAQLGIGDYDWLTGTFTWSEQARVIYGCPAGVPITPEQILSQVHPLDRGRVEAVLVRGGELTGRERYELEHRIVRSDGTIGWVQLKGATLFANENGQRRPRRTVAVVWDITQRKRLEEKFRLVVESAPNAIVVTSADGKMVLVNAQTEKLFGYPRQELLGQPVELLVPERFRDNHPASRAAFFASPEVRAMGAGRDLYGRRRDGSEFPVEIGLNPIDSEDGMLVLAAIVDITQRQRLEEERRQLEARILQEQKMQSLGVLAGGIAHDFNNLLTSVLGYASLAADALRPESPARPMLAEIEKAARRAADLSLQMLAYSGKGRFIVRLLDLSRVVEEMAPLFQMVSTPRIALRLDLHPRLPPIEADATQLRQMIMNLITNAHEALGEAGGFITLRTGVLQATRSDLVSPHITEELPEGAYVSLEVEDTGSGVSEDAMGKLFDPFFTTKFTGRGLGLAAVLGIVRGHRGTIQVQSQPGQGARFRILLPCTDLSPETTSPSIRPAWRGRGTVLVVEDEAGIRGLARTILESAGFAVQLAEDGRHGLERLEHAGPEVRLLLLDLTMPHHSGEEVLREVRQRRPDLPVVLMSGYSAEEVNQRLQGQDAAHFVQKPFSPNDLLNAVRRALGE